MTTTGFSVHSPGSHRKRKRKEGMNFKKRDSMDSSLAARERNVASPREKLCARRTPGSRLLLLCRLGRSSQIWSPCRRSSPYVHPGPLLFSALHGIALRRDDAFAPQPSIKNTIFQFIGLLKKYLLSEFDEMSEFVIAESAKR